MSTAASPARGPLGALFSPARNIRWRIIAPYAGLTIALAIAGTYLTTRLVGGSLDERFNNQLAEAGRVASDALVRRERAHLETVRAIAYTDGVGAATASRAPFEVARLVQPVVSNAGVERVEVLDADGRRLYGAQLTDSASRTYESIVEPENRFAWESVRNVIGLQGDALGDKFSEIVDVGDGSVLYTAAPIYDGDRVVGAVLAGTRLETFVADAKLEALADVTIYDRSGAPAASTFGEDAPHASALALSSLDQPLREHQSLFGRDFDLLYGTLALRGRPVAAYSVALPSDFIFSAQDDTRTQMAILFTAGMAIALAIGWLISKTLTDPVSRLVAAANAVSGGDLSARSGVRGFDEIGVLGRAFDEMTERLQRQLLSTVRALTSAIDARDPYTLGHSMRVGQLAVALGRELDLPDATLQHLEIGGYLHDIGKIGVRDNVLLKPASLTPAERDAIERHPRIGLDILEHVELAPEVLEFVGGHHEKLDGSGYPAHRHGDAIGMVARIATVADIYDALTTDRPYRPAMTPHRALDILHDEVAEGRVDGRVVATLERIMPWWERRRRDEPELRGFSVGATRQPATELEEAVA